MHLTAHLDVDLVAIETEDDVTVLLDLTAPVTASGAGKRPPATLQVVLDRSGSMAEGDRLEGAKRALVALVDRLDPSDNFGVIAFDDAVQVTVPAGPVSDKATVTAQLAALTPGGMTDLSGGYLRGLQEARRAAGATGATLLLISDGHANQGVTDHDQLRRTARGGHGHQVVTSTLGYGLGYDEELLGAIADGGAGEALFAEDPDTAGKLIAAQVEGLLTKAAQAVNLLIRTQAPVGSLFVHGDLPSVQLPDDAVMVELGDLWAGETRKVLLRFAVPALAALGLAQIAELRLQYVELPALTSHTVTVPISVNVVPGDEAAGRIPDPVVRTEVAFQQAQQAKRDADEVLRRGDAVGAGRLLAAGATALTEALSLAPPHLGAELAAEAAELADLADRVRWDDAGRVRRANYSSWHSGTRKRGRPRPPTP